MDGDKCKCKTDFFRENDAADCGETCTGAQTKVNDGKTACECKADHLGDPKNKCIACKAADSDVKCLCKSGFSGDDCATEDKGGNGFVQTMVLLLVGLVLQL